MEKSHDTIYITNLPDTVTEEKLAEVFGSIGIIKHDRKVDKPKSKAVFLVLDEKSFLSLTCQCSVWIYTDKATGKPKGDGMFYVGSFKRCSLDLIMFALSLQLLSPMTIHRLLMLL
jgi:RNA recognition motif-containing protein